MWRQSQQGGAQVVCTFKSSACAETACCALAVAAACPSAAHHRLTVSAALVHCSVAMLSIQVLRAQAGVGEAGGRAV